MFNKILIVVIWGSNFKGFLISYSFLLLFRSAFLCTLIYKFIKRVQYNTSKWNLLELLSCYCNFRQLIIIFILEYMTTLSLDIQLQITLNNTPAITKVAYSWNLISLIFSCIGIKVTVYNKKKKPSVIIVLFNRIYHSRY